MPYAVRAALLLLLLASVRAEERPHPNRIERAGDKFRILCNGRDGKPGTDDDIAYPEPPLRRR